MLRSTEARFSRILAVVVLCAPVGLFYEDCSGYPWERSQNCWDASPQAKLPRARTAEFQWATA